MDRFRPYRPAAHPLAGAAIENPVERLAYAMRILILARTPRIAPLDVVHEYGPLQSAEAAGAEAGRETRARSSVPMPA